MATVIGSMLGSDEMSGLQAEVKVVNSGIVLPPMNRGGHSIDFPGWRYRMADNLSADQENP